MVCTRMSGVLTAVREMAGRESVGAGQGAKGQKFHFGHVEPEIPIRNPRGWRRRRRLQAGAEEGLSGHSALTSPAPGRPRRAQAGLRTAASHTKGWREREEQGRGVRREGSGQPPSRCCPGLTDPIHPGLRARGYCRALDRPSPGCGSSSQRSHLVSIKGLRQVYVQCGNSGASRT